MCTQELDYDITDIQTIRLAFQWARNFIGQNGYDTTAYEGVIFEFQIKDTQESTVEFPPIKVYKVRDFFEYKNTVDY